MKNGVGGFDVHSDWAGEEGGKVDKDERGDVDGVESVDPEASEDGSGDRGGSLNSSGSSTSGTARVTSVRVMKKYASFRTVKMTRTVLTDIKVAIITQERQWMTTERNDTTQVASITLKRGSE